ncbi:hypothetical protein ZTR_10338 [Talaromyces verruculosus]|nr:hypothetical protein ZTR_10338 [Talaromyces verruculosus]
MLSNIHKTDRETKFYEDTEHWSLLREVNSKPETTLSDDQRPDFTSHPTNKHRQVEERASPETSKADQLVRLRKGSPWGIYRKRYEIELAGWNAVCQTQPPTTRLFGVRRLGGPDVKEQAQLLRQLHHENLLEIYEIFVGIDAYYTVSEDVEISLEEIVAAPILPNEIELAAIVCQVSYGSRITITLMEKEPPGSTILLERPDQWSPDAVNFVSLTFAASLKDLREINESFEYALKDVCVNAVERLIDRARLGTLTREDIDNELALIEATLLALPREDTELLEHVRFENNTHEQ